MKLAAIIISGIATICLLVAWQITNPPSSGGTTIINGNNNITQVISGCGEQYVSGLTFTFGQCNYSILGTPYSASQTPFTLNTADPSNTRIDLIAVDVTGSYVYTPGTPASTAVCPTQNTATQLSLYCIAIAANATTPSNVSNVVIFDEEAGGEYTTTPSANIVYGTSNPYSGTHALNATNAVLNNNVTFAVPAAGTVNLSNYTNLILYLRSKANWPTGSGGANAARQLGLYWTRSSAQVGTQVVVKDGTFGFSSSVTGNYQQISIPVGLFQTYGNALDTLTVAVVGPSGTSSIGFYLDYITLQSATNGSPAVSSGGGLVLLEQHSAASSSELDFISCISNAFDIYQIEGLALVAATNQAEIILQVHSAGSYVTTGYDSNLLAYVLDGTNGTVNVVVTDGFAFTNNFGPSVARATFSGTLKLFSPAFTGIAKVYTMTGAGTNGNTSKWYAYSGGGNWDNGTGAAYDGFRVLASSGNLTSGTVRCYGVSPK